MSTLNKKNSFDLILEQIILYVIIHFIVFCFHIPHHG